MGQHTRWDDWLVAEHEMIERAMEVLKVNLGKVADGSHDPVQTGRAIDFLYEFGDKIHNIKEEKYLFPLMHERGVPKEGGPIGVMLMEHEMERELLVKMQADLPGLKDADTDVKEEYVAKGLEYLQIRAEHIWKENDILYNMARQMLSEDDFTTLLEQFKESDLQFYGPDAADKFDAMLEEVEEGGRKKRLVNNLSMDQIDAIMETLPVEVTFVDAEDTVAYFNRLDKEKIFPRTRSVIGRRVEKCHPEKSVHMVTKIVEGFKNRTMDKAEFWIDFRGEKVLIRYFPVFNEEDEYMGVLEVTQEIGWLQKLKGQKLLLD